MGKQNLYLIPMLKRHGMAFKQTRLLPLKDFMKMPLLLEIPKGKLEETPNPLVLYLLGRNIFNPMILEEINHPLMLKHL